ncbi:hypothetical protein CWATWH0003_B081 [Crocosphaera watsonii WH 0003]|uniref:Uncharacterized protein n=1 Tax=Crocosphaera watsonii WH 0003 TaxID=423471 RepID=G5JE94_CROWT|nr:hypothetical protein CWATWH0003_B081 [Crocosphaera watsonii WH 0003]
MSGNPVVGKPTERVHQAFPRMILRDQVCQKQAVTFQE